MSKDEEPDADAENSEPEAEEPLLEDETRKSRVMRFARRLMDRKDLAEDTRAMVAARA